MTLTPTVAEARDLATALGKAVFNEIDRRQQLNLELITETLYRELLVILAEGEKTPGPAPADMGTMVQHDGATRGDVVAPPQLLHDEAIAWVAENMRKAFGKALPGYYIGAPDAEMRGRWVKAARYLEGATWPQPLDSLTEDVRKAWWGDTTAHINFTELHLRHRAAWREAVLAGLRSLGRPLDAEKV